MDFLDISSSNGLWQKDDLQQNSSMVREGQGNSKVQCSLGENDLNEHALEVESNNDSGLGDLRANEIDDLKRQNPSEEANGSRTQCLEDDRHTLEVIREVGLGK